MATLPGGNLALARDASLDHLSSDPAVVGQLEELHDLVLSVCPGCLIKQREDDGLIYVPPEREHADRHKNLLTMWAEGGGVRMRIMPDPEEMYDPCERERYLERLRLLHVELVGRGV